MPRAGLGDSRLIPGLLVLVGLRTALLGLCEPPGPPSYLSLDLARAIERPTPPARAGRGLGSRLVTSLTWSWISTSRVHRHLLQDHAHVEDRRESSRPRGAALPGVSGVIGSPGGSAHVDQKKNECELCSDSVLDRVLLMRQASFWAGARFYGLPAHRHEKEEFHELARCSSACLACHHFPRPALSSRRRVQRRARARNSYATVWRPAGSRSR